MIDTGFGCSFKVVKEMGDTAVVIDNNLPNSRWERRRRVL